MISCAAENPAGFKRWTPSSGSIYLSEHTGRLVQVYFALEDLGEFTVKGVSEPTRVYELTCVGGACTRFDLSRARGLVRFVGRDAEVRTLEAGSNAPDAAKGRCSASSPTPAPARAGCATSLPSTAAPRA